LAVDPGNNPGHSFFSSTAIRWLEILFEVIVNLRAEGGLVNSQNVVQPEEFIERSFGGSKSPIPDESRY
jgi:hypothetical protein